MKIISRFFAGFIIFGSLIGLSLVNSENANHLLATTVTTSAKPTPETLSPENVERLIEINRFAVADFSGFDGEPAEYIIDIEWTEDHLYMLTNVGAIATSVCLEDFSIAASDTPPLGALAVLSKNVLITSTRDGEIVELNFSENGYRILAWVEDVGLLTDIEILGDNQWLLAAKDSVYVFDMDDWTLVTEIESMNYEIADISVNSVDMRLGVIGYQALEIFDISDFPKLSLVYYNSTFGFTGDEVKFGAEDELFIGAASRLSFVNIATEQITTVENLSIDSRDMDLSPNTNILAVTGGYAGTIELWHPPKKTSLSTIIHSQENEMRSLKRFVHHVEFSPDGEYLASASLSQVIIWGIDKPRTCN